MKVLFLISRFLDGGIDTVLVEYLNNIVRLTDYKVTLAISINYGKDLEVYTSRLDKRIDVIHIINDNILTYHKRNAHRNRKNKMLSVFDEIVLNPIRRVIIQQSIKNLIAQNDCVIDFDSCHSAFIPADTDKRRIAFYHFSLKKEMQRKPHRLKRFIRRLSHYDRLVTISDAMYDEAVTLCPTEKDKFCRIYNCINQKQLIEKGEEQVTDPRIKAGYMLAVERLEESQKDITTLIKAYAQAYSRNKNIPLLYIIGEGKSRKFLQQLIYDTGMTDRVVLLGFCSNPIPWMKTAEYIVHSSKFEGLPTVLIEALLMNKLIVSSDCPTGPREILNNGAAGILVPVGDVSALSDIMLNIASNKIDRDTFLLNAAKHSHLFLPENSINQLISIIK